MSKVCSVDDCNKLVFCRGWCSMHYARWQRHGDPLIVLVTHHDPVELKIWKYIDKTGEHWLWTGSLSPEGYGRVAVNRTPHYVHRVVYELLVGPIPKGKELDHLCRVVACCKPSHLEPVSHRENLLRGTGISARNARKTHCPQGHPYSGDNLKINDKGHRRCRICLVNRKRRGSGIA